MRGLRIEGHEKQRLHATSQWLSRTAKPVRLGLVAGHWRRYRSGLPHPEPFFQFSSACERTEDGRSNAVWRSRPVGATGWEWGLA